MLVVDAAILIDIVTGTPTGATHRDRLRIDDDQAAPEVVDVEVFGVIRRRYLLGRLDRTAAMLAVEGLHDWSGERFTHQPFLSRAWELRHNVRGWDAFYVALAEALDATLLTTDTSSRPPTGGVSGRSIGLATPRKVNVALVSSSTSSPRSVSTTMIWPGEACYPVLGTCATTFAAGTPSTSRWPNPSTPR